MAEDKSAGEKLVNSVALTLLSRLAMIVATGLVLPVALLMLQRGLSTVDEMSKKIDAMRDQGFETSGALRLMQQAQGEHKAQLVDHELRIRGLELVNRAAPITRN